MQAGVYRREQTRSSTGKCTHPHVHTHSLELQQSSHFTAAIVTTSLAGARSSIWAKSLTRAVRVTIPVSRRHCFSRWRRRASG
jgi:hypothetical protein